MARLPALVTALAQTDGRERSTIDVIGRFLREDGLLSKKGRGVGAANMTSQDAAYLLIGASAVQAPKDAVQAVRQLCTLKQAPHGRRTEGEVFTRLAAADTLEVALQLLIEEAANLDEIGRNWTERAYAKPGKVVPEAIYRLAGPKLFIEFARGSVTIDYSISRNGNHEVEHQWLFLPDADLMMGGFYTLAENFADRSVKTTIGLPTLLGLHTALHSLPPVVAPKSRASSPHLDGTFRTVGQQTAPGESRLEVGHKERC